MNIPSTPTQAISGKVSWFGGPGDSTDSGHTANGETTKTPGIAVYNRSTLGGYWRVTANNGRTAILKQTDLGPAPFTGRKIDVTYSALGKFGYGEHNFPTDSNFKAEYLGRNPPKGTAQGLTQLSAPAQSSTPEKSGPVFDQAAFKKASTAASIGKLFSAEDRKDNPLFATGILSTKEPSRSEFVKEGASLPGPTPSSSAASQSIPSAPGGKLGGFLPANAPLTEGRLDQGFDSATKPGGPIIAPGDGVVVAVNNNPGGFGERYPVVKFTSGPLAGKTVYIGHTHSDLPVGARFHAGQPLSHTGFGTAREGNARTPGWSEIGFWGPNGPGGMEEGKKIAPYLRKR